MKEKFSPGDALYSIIRGAGMSEAKAISTKLGNTQPLTWLNSEITTNSRSG